MSGVCTACLGDDLNGPYLRAVPGTDATLVLPQRRVDDPVAADVDTLALHTEVGGLVVGAGSAVYHIVPRVVILLTRGRVSQDTCSLPHLALSVVASQLTLEVVVFLFEGNPGLAKLLLILLRCCDKEL